MTSEINELIERVRRRLDAARTPCTVAGGASETAIAAAETALECKFPPSYRQFLKRFGALSLPTNLGVVHTFVGIDPKAPDGKNVVERTLHARAENRLGEHLVMVGMGADSAEWFCIDLDQPDEDGECPVLMFDARINELDQQFYDGFGQMVHEVLGFIEQHLDGDHVD